MEWWSALSERIQGSGLCIVYLYGQTTIPSSFVSALNCLLFSSDSFTALSGRYRYLYDSTLFVYDFQGMALSKKPITGMKDILPEEMEIRDYVIGVIKETRFTLSSGKPASISSDCTPSVPILSILSRMIKI